METAKSERMSEQELRQERRTWQREEIGENEREPGRHDEKWETIGKREGEKGNEQILIHRPQKRERRIPIQPKREI